MAALRRLRREPGRLRIYLGAAPGVGKTYAMLGEGAGASSRGTDVVVGFVETHGRRDTADRLEGLEVVPRRGGSPGRRRWRRWTSTRCSPAPEVALVDELAHTNAPGSRHAKRWQDVEELLDAGIDVVSTVNVQHLESLNDVVERITGVRQRETVPDRHGARRRAGGAGRHDARGPAPPHGHGNIYAPTRSTPPSATTSARATWARCASWPCLWLADKVDEAMRRYLHDERIVGTWETRERVVVAITGAPSGDHLIRRAARMARRSHGDLIGVHIRPGTGLREGPNEALLAHRALLADLGGTYHETTSDDVAEGLVAFAESVRATQIVLGASHRNRLSELVRGSVINRVIRAAGEIDVHVISRNGGAERAPLPSAHRRRRSPLSRRRRAAGWALAVVGLPLLTVILDAARNSIGLPSVLVIYLLYVCIVAAIGGFGPAFVTALASTAAANWYFTQPLYTLRIKDPEHLIAVAAFVSAGGLVSLLVARTARRTADAARARAETEALVDVVGADAGENDPVAVLLSHLRITFGQQAAAVFVRGDERSWSVVAVDGPDPTADPADGERLELGEHHLLTLTPGGLTAADRRVLGAFATRLVEALQRRVLEAAAGDRAALARADELRTAILRAVSHDLRSPLASIKASSTSLLQDDVDWNAEQRTEFARTIDEEADRLDELIGNLLDMSRIEAGAVEIIVRPVGLDDAIAAALASLSEATERVVIELDDDAPAALADAGLFERVLANIVSNALNHSPADRKVVVQATSHDGSAVTRIIDHGPGVSPEARATMFQPFQRFGDDTSGGVGLGLAVARGFMTAMHGVLSAEETPGGGLTVTLSLPLAERSDAMPPLGPDPGAPVSAGRTAGRSPLEATP
jgi:two-component system sensor histidine kinase KdpD